MGHLDFVIEFDIALFTRVLLWAGVHVIAEVPLYDTRRDFPASKSSLGPAEQVP